MGDVSQGKKGSFVEKLSNVMLLTYFLNGGLFLLHTVFAIIFSWLGAEIMFYYNFISIATYVVCFFLIQKGLSSVYVVIMYAEIFIFMVLGTISLGWDFGFHHYSYGFLVSTMFADFFVGARERMKKRTYFLSVFVIAVYIGMRIWTWHHPYIDTVDNPRLIRVFFVINIIVAMGFIAAFIVVYASNAYRMQKELNERATKDLLTGLSNRRYMQGLLDDKLKNRTDDNIGIAIFDIDFFKKVNDNYGHDAGDIVLQTVAGMLMSTRTDIVDMMPSRWGGEEFLLLFIPVRRISTEQFENEITDICEEIRIRISQHPARYMDADIPIRVSAGVTVFKEGMDDKSFFKKADDLLYYAKDHGRDQVINEVRRHISEHSEAARG